MAIMNSIAYKRKVQLFENLAFVQNLVSGVYRNFDICEREDGKLLAVWSKSDDYLNYADFYICDGADVSDVFNTPFYMETAPMTSKFITLQGDFTGISKACNCFSMHGKSFICLIDAGKVEPAKPIDMHMYSKPSLSGSFSKILTQRTSESVNPYWYGNNSYASTRLGIASSNNRGTIFMPVAIGSGMGSYFAQLYSLDYGNTWHYKRTFEEVTDVNWGSGITGGWHLPSVWTGDRFIMTISGNAIFPACYAMESFDGINWTNHNLGGQNFSSIWEDQHNFTVAMDKLYFARSGNGVYSRTNVGVTSKNFLDKNMYSYQVFPLNPSTYRSRMEYLMWSGYLATSFINDGTAKMLFRW